MSIDLSIVVAMTPKRVIGNKGGLPWGRKIPSDLARFKELTIKVGVVIMGYTTYASIIEQNGKPLSDRKSIVLTKKHIKPKHPTVQFVGSLQDALVAVASNGNKACVVGGEQIFKIFLPVRELTTLYITKVHAPLCGDTYFPGTENTKPGWTWKCVDVSDIGRPDPRDEYPTSYETYRRFPYR